LRRSSVGGGGVFEVVGGAACWVWGGGGGGGGLPFRVAAEAAASWGQLMKIKVDFGQG